MERIGKTITVAETMREIEKDIVFYDQSGGGVTFSGGEPLMQIDFLDDLISACKAKRLHVAVDTSGYAPWDSLARIMDRVDLFLYDIKLIDEEKHLKYTGVSNAIILENLKKLSDAKRNIWIRVPIIQGVNDDRENKDKMANILAQLGLRNVYLLPYHNIATGKYDNLKKTINCQISNLSPIDKQRK